jgi:peptidoglycan/LPS O-acetylase OafA/YrhL
LYRLFIFKYLYYFLFGVIAYIYWERIYLFFVNKFFLYSITYIFYFSILGIFFGQIDIVSYTITSPAGFVANILLSVWTLAAAFTIGNIFDKIKNIDISYGIYIYHMPIINLFLSNNLLYQSKFLFLILFIILLISLFSWFFIEKPILNLKRK